MTYLVAHGLDDLRVEKRLVLAEVTREYVSVDDDLIPKSTLKRPSALL
jgi:hypothetical protein